MDELPQLIDSLPAIESGAPHAPRPAFSPLPPSDALDDLMSYRHVPFHQAGTRHVRYGQIEPLAPRKFEYVEDNE